MQISKLAKPDLKHMAWIPGGTFSMGSEDFYPEERPVRRLRVDGFWMDEHPVTVAEFRRFVSDTGYVTVAERVPDAAAFPDADASLLVPGSLVFQKSRGPVDLRDFRNWWAYVPGASWRNPTGKGLTGLERHPVTHVAYQDVQAYAGWSGKDVPTEAEWEFAARGGLEGAVYCWGDEFTPRGRVMANTWQGQFPWQNLQLDGYEGTSPAKSFAPNGYGLYDMAGNVWEWISDYFTVPEAGEVHTCCVPLNPRVDQPDASLADHSQEVRRVIKGGSHLCAPNYCLRYRPAARQGQELDSSTCHIGFRCVVRM